MLAKKETLVSAFALTEMQEETNFAGKIFNQN